MTSSYPESVTQLLRYATKAMSKDPHKDALKKAWKEQEDQKLLASIPMPKEKLNALFDFLDREGAPPCDHTHRETIQFLRENQIPIEPTIVWLREHGGFCDCEVICNVEDEFGEIIGR